MQIVATHSMMCEAMPKEMCDVYCIHCPFNTKESMDEFWSKLKKLGIEYHMYKKNREYAKVSDD